MIKKNFIFPEIFTQLFFFSNNFYTSQWSCCWRITRVRMMKKKWKRNLISFPFLLLRYSYEMRWWILKKVIRKEENFFTVQAGNLNNFHSFSLIFFFISTVVLLNTSTFMQKFNHQILLNLSIHHLLVDIVVRFHHVVEFHSIVPLHSHFIPKSLKLRLIFSKDDIVS